MNERAGRAPLSVKIGIGVFAAVVVGIFILVAFSAARRATSDCPLCEAVDTNDPDQVRSALDRKAPMDDRAWQLAVLNLSNSHGDAQAMAIARLLVEHGANPNASWVVGGSSSTRSTPQRAGSELWASSVLAQASAAPDLVDTMVAHGLDVTGTAAAEALIGAVIMERTAAVRSLLRAGVPPNRQDGETGPSALAQAIQTRNLDLIREIEAAGGLEW